MRKAVVSGLVMFILSSGCLFAQVSFGIKAGAGMSSYSGSDWEDYLSVNGTDNRFGFLASAGGFINYKFNKVLHCSWKPCSQQFPVDGAEP